MVLLRRVRRLTSFENGDIENVWKIEFRDGDKPDTNISVYEVEDRQAHFVQAQSEHCVSVPIDPPTRDCDGINLSGFSIGEVAATTGSTKFSFTQITHREVRVGTFENLQLLIKSIAEERDNIIRVAPKVEMKRYVRQKLDEEKDEEWTAACTEEWARWARKK